MKCENCPAGWEDRSYEGECNDCGCLIMGRDIFKDDCRLSRAEIDRRLKQLEDYHSGKIKRPKWVVERFIRELDHCAVLFRLGLGVPSYPPIKTKDNVYYSLHGNTDMHYQSESEYRRGYEDGKNNREYDFDRKHENERWEEERKKYECELF